LKKLEWFSVVHFYSNRKSKLVMKNVGFTDKIAVSKFPGRAKYLCALPVFPPTRRELLSLGGIKIKAKYSNSTTPPSPILVLTKSGPP
jgi:hypothetical protein